MKKVSKKILISSSLVLLTLVGVTLCIDYALFKPTKINSFIASKIYKTPANTAFTDENFYKCVIDAYNSNNNASVAYTESLTDEQLETIKHLNCNGYNKSDEEKIINVNGLEKLVNITELYLTDNLITNIDLSNNKKIQELRIDDNKLTNIIFDNNINLTWLTAYNNQLENIDFINIPNLEILYVGKNLFKNLDLSAGINLKKVYAYENNQLTNITSNNNAYLLELDVHKAALTNLNLIGAPNIVELCIDENQLTSLDLSNNLSLEILSASENQITSLDLSNNKMLNSINIENNKLITLVLGNNEKLEYLIAHNNQLSELNVSNNINLKKINVSTNKIKVIDVSNNILLTDLLVSKNYLTNLNLNNNIALTTLYANNNKLENLILGEIENLMYLYLSENQLIELDVSKNKKLVGLSVDENQLTKLNINGATALERLSVGFNQLNSLDVRTNSKLTTLYVPYNQLVELDVSKNTSLKSLYIYSNYFTENKGIYKNEKKKIINNSSVILPISATSTLSTIENPYMCGNIEILNDEVSSTETGLYKINLEYTHSIQETSNSFKVFVDLYVIEATSNKYDINAEKGYIYTKTDTEEETILRNINLNYGEASIENNELLIKYNGELIKSFDIVSISNKKYDLSKNYIYTGTNDLSLEDINITNGEKIVEDSKLKIKYNDNILKEYDLIKISSSKYDLTKEYIFDNNFNVNNVTLTNGTKELKDNKLLIKYNDEIFKSIDIVKIESNKYNLNKNYIYTGTDDLNLNDINVINGQKIVENNKLKIKYNEDLLKEYSIFNINFGEYKTYDGLLVLPEDITYDEFTNNITTNGVTYKIFSEESEVTEGNISEGMIIKIYYGDEVIDEYEVTNEYLEFDESLNIDNEVNIIEKLPLNLKLKDFISLIRTSGSIEIRNNNNELLSDDSIIGTGSKLKITLSKRTVEYTLSVRGDVTGNGQAKMADVMKIATHIIEGNVIEGTAFERAADIIGDGKIKMNDVMKLATFIIDEGEL